MTRNVKFSTLLAGVMGLSTLFMFHQGAQALDLSDFSGADQKVITQDAPKAGGIVLVKQDIVYPSQPTRVQATVAQPMMRTGYNAPALTGPAGYNDIMPAAGGTTATQAGYRSSGDGSTGVPGKGIDNHLDVTTMPGNSFDQAEAKFSGAVASAPVDGKPLTTTTTADGARVNDLNAVAPAAGMTPVAVDQGRSIEAQTHRRYSTYNN